MKRRAATCLLALVLAACATTSPTRRTHNCDNSDFLAQRDQTTKIVFAIQSGVACGITMVSSAQFVERTVITPAQHGVGRWDANKTLRWFYKSDPGYVGQDRFVLEAKYRRADNGQLAFARYDILVTVLPKFEYGDRLPSDPRY